MVALDGASGHFLLERLAGVSPSGRRNGSTWSACAEPPETKGRALRLALTIARHGAGAVAAAAPAACRPLSAPELRRSRLVSASVAAPAGAERRLSSVPELHRSRLVSALAEVDLCRQRRGARLVIISEAARRRLVLGSGKGTSVAPAGAVRRSSIIICSSSSWPPRFARRKWLVVALRVDEMVWDGCGRDAARVSVGADRD